MPQAIFHSKKTAKMAAPYMKGLRPKIIKKYGNRKLYDTEKSEYVVLKDIEKMIRNNENIKIIDNETQVDITAPTLTQIILWAEKKSNVSTPVEILKSIIAGGDGGFSSFLAKTSPAGSDFQGGKSSRGRHGRSGMRARGKMRGAGKAAAKGGMPSARAGRKPFSEDFIPKLPGARFND